MEQGFNDAFSALNHQIGQIGRIGQGMSDYDDDYSDYEPFEGSHSEQRPDFMNPPPQMPTRPFGRIPMMNVFRSPANPFASLFGGVRTSNWWDGENVCVDRVVVEEPQEEEPEKEGSSEPVSPFNFRIKTDMTLTSCRDDLTYHECTTKYNRNGAKKSVTVKHKCCYGFTRTSNDEMGCTEMEMKSMMQTLEDLEVDEFLSLAKAADALETFNGDLNVTVFAPTDDAVEDFRMDLEQFNALEEKAVSYNIEYDDEDAEINDLLKNENFEIQLLRKKRDLVEVDSPHVPDMKELINGHVVEGIVDTSDMKDESLLK